MGKSIEGVPKAAKMLSQVSKLAKEQFPWTVEAAKRSRAVKAFTTEAKLIKRDIEMAKAKIALPKVFNEAANPTPSFHLATQSSKTKAVVTASKRALSQAVARGQASKANTRSTAITRQSPGQGRGR